MSIRAAYNSGIIDYAINGTKKYQEEATKEDSIISETEEFMKSIIAKLDDLSGDDNLDELPSTPGTQPYLPGDDFEPVPDTDLTTGLVIEDEDGNQFVWVEVPNDGTGPNYSSVANANDTEHISAALIAYASDYRIEGHTDTYYEGCGISSQSAYEELYAEMVSSVYTHGGFWIGRYETGIPQEDSFNGTVTQRIVVQKDVYPCYGVPIAEAQNLASNINSGDYTSSLLFGIQWDLTLKFLEVKANWDTTGGYAAIDYIKYNSDWNYENHGPGCTSWGNYSDSEFEITSPNALYAYSIGYELIWSEDLSDSEGKVENRIKMENTGILLTTGANETRNSKMNIVDLAGNLEEITLSNPGVYGYVSRGGYYRTVTAGVIQLFPIVLTRLREDLLGGKGLECHFGEKRISMSQ